MSTMDPSYNRQQGPAKNYYELEKELTAALAAKELAEGRNAVIVSALDDFRDTILNQRGALAENGMDGDQVNDVLREFDIRFPVFPSPDEAAAELLRDRERLEALSNLFPEATHWIIRDRSMQKVNTTPNGFTEYMSLSDLADAAIAQEQAK